MMITKWKSGVCYLLFIRHAHVEWSTVWSTGGKILKWETDIKAVPLQAWSGPEGSRKLRFPDF